MSNLRSASVSPAGVLRVNNASYNAAVVRLHTFCHSGSCSDVQQRQPISDVSPPFRVTTPPLPGSVAAWGRQAHPPNGVFFSSPYGLDSVLPRSCPLLEYPPRYWTGAIRRTSAATRGAVRPPEGRQHQGWGCAALVARRRPSRAILAAPVRREPPAPGDVPRAPPWPA